MTRGAKERKVKKKKVHCGSCGKEVTLDKNSCCTKCGAVIILGVD